MNHIQIDALCQRTTSPAVLNALHACRDGHPLGRDNDYKWRNAYALAAQRSVDFLSVDLSYLRDKAAAEAAA